MSSDSLAAFREYDFDSNTKWLQYKGSLEIPAGKDVDQVLARLKAKWYKREVDSEFDPSLVSGGSQPTPSKAATAGAAEAGHESMPRNGGPSGHSASGTPSSAAPQGILAKLLRMLSANPEERLFFLHSALIVFAIMHVQPVFRVWSHRAWSYFLQTAVLTHGYKVYLKHGFPQLWPFSFAAIKQYMVPVSAMTDFQYALLSIVFLTAKPILLIMVPIVSLAVYHFFAYASKHYGTTGLWQKYGAGAHRWLIEHQQQTLLYNAAAEVGSGFLVVLSLLAPPRNIFLVFIYWQFLRMRYWSPDAANYHRMVWGQLDEKFGRYLNYVPILKMPAGYIQRWFQNAPGG